MSGLAITLNGWSTGAFGPVWVWLGTPGASPWLGLLAVLLIGSRVLDASRRASFANAAGRVEGAERVWKLALTSVLATLVALAVSDTLCSRVLKPLVAEARPCAVGVTVVPKPLECGSGYGMPSAHAANSAAVAATIGSPALAAVAVVVGVSRVVDGEHWPTDVLAGWFVGGFIGAGFRRLAEWLAS